MNRVIKQTKPTQYGKKSLTLLEYVEKIKSEVKRQHEEQFLAVISRGEYRLRKEFQFLAVSETDFYRMTPKQKAELKTRFFKASVSDTSEKANTALHIVDSLVNYSLSVTAAQSQIIDVPFPYSNQCLRKHRGQSKIKTFGKYPLLKMVNSQLS